MNIRKLCLPALAMLASACGSIEGVVRDGASGTPIADADVTLTYSDDPSGFFGGPQTKHATTQTDGRFTLDQDGGIDLSVSTSTGRAVRASLCPRSPFDVYVGGPFEGVRTNSTLVLMSSGEPRTQDFPEENRKMAGDLGLTFSEIGDGNDDGYNIEAAGGIAFVPGTGAIPAPPPLPYSQNLFLDFATECGWLFVQRNDRVVAAIEARPPTSLATPEGYKETRLMFAELP